MGHEGALVAYAMDSGEELPGQVQDVSGPTDLQALGDGRLVVNLSGRDEVLVVDGSTMLELARIRSSTGAGSRPVHGYLTPPREGRQYWLALNDGDGTAASNSAVLVDLTASSPSLHALVGERALGLGHHKASFSSTRERVVISSMEDCDDVLTVYDYGDPSHMAALATLSAEEAGWDGATFATTCDPTYQAGLPPSPHGCATSAVSGKAYCNLTGSGQLAVVDLDADPPTFELIATGGAGGGYTRTSPGGAYVYSLQAEPREASLENPGAPCQIGQLVVIDARSDLLRDEVPLFYDGPECGRELAGSDEETSEPAHLVIHADKLFVTLAGGFMVDAARVRRELVLDVADPAHPLQVAALEIGTSTGYHGDALSGDGLRLFVANNLDATVSEIDAHGGEVVRLMAVRDRPAVLATWNAEEGPSHPSGPIE